MSKPKHPKYVKQKQAVRLNIMEAACFLMGRILETKNPPDKTLVSAFREPDFRHFGKQDRQKLFDLIYTALRYRVSLADMAGTMVGADMFRYLSDILDCQAGLPFATIRQQHYQNGSLPSELPDWLRDLFITQYGKTAFEALSQSLLKTAPVDFRVNIAKTDRSTVLKKLGEKGVVAAPTPYSPWGIRLLDNHNLLQSDIYQQGLIEVQDEGSQLIALLLGAKRNEWVIDFCAGAGGKTLAMGMMMRATGRLYALDTAGERLSHLQPRLARSGLSTVVCQRIENMNDARLAKWQGKADRVLVDAPCSGLGTLRRNPALKWQYQPEDIDQFSKQQYAILEAASRLVKPGGVLVYATCSLLCAENEVVVDEFLQHHPAFMRESAKDILKKQGVNGIDQEALILLPHQHQTDGFYAARLTRQEGNK